MNVTGFYAANWSSVHGCGGRRAPYRSPRRSGPSGRHGVRPEASGPLRAAARAATARPASRWWAWRPWTTPAAPPGRRDSEAWAQTPGPRAGRRRRLTVGVVAPAGDRAVVGAKSAGMPDAAAHRRETLPRRWPVRQIPPADRGSVHLETAGVTAAAADGPKPLVRRRVTRQIGTFRMPQQIGGPSSGKPHVYPYAPSIDAKWASGGA